MALLLPALTIAPVSARDDSTATVTVTNSRFRVEIDLRIGLEIDDLGQFIDAEDAYSRERGGFRGALEESIETGIQELVPEASVTELDISKLDCDESDKKMLVVLSFDVEGVITGETTKEYNLKWRSFIAPGKFEAANRRIQPAEALGLDFHDFENDLDEWTVIVSSGNTVLQREEEYELNADDGEVELRVKMSFRLLGTGMTIGDDTVTSGETRGNGGTQPEPPRIPGFPWGGTVIGVVLAVAIIIGKRSRPPKPQVS